MKVQVDEKSFQLTIRPSLRSWQMWIIIFIFKLVGAQLLSDFFQISCYAFPISRELEILTVLKSVFNLLFAMILFYGDLN